MQFWIYNTIVQTDRLDDGEVWGRDQKYPTEITT